jgi:hypothetical protein
MKSTETSLARGKEIQIISRRAFVTVGAILFIVTLSCCQTVGHQYILSASESPPPTWPNHVPEPRDGFVYFVGVSSGNATERSALEQARQDVIKQAQEYLGGFAKRDFQERAVRMGLDSSTFDPTVAARDLVAYASENFVSKVRTKESYWEYRRTAGGDQYFAYVLIPLPVNQSMSQFADQQIADAQRRVQEAKTEEAKKQAQNVLEFWQQTESMFTNK